MRDGSALQPTLYLCSNRYSWSSTWVFTEEKPGLNQEVGGKQFSCLSCRWLEANRWPQERVKTGVRRWLMDFESWFLGDELLAARSDAGGGEYVLWELTIKESRMKRAKAAVMKHEIQKHWSSPKRGHSQRTWSETVSESTNLFHQRQVKIWRSE